MIRRTTVDVVSRDRPGVVDADTERARIVGTARAGSVERSERARGTLRETVAHAVDRVITGDGPLLVNARRQRARAKIARHAELDEHARRAAHKPMRQARVVDVVSRDSSGAVDAGRIGALKIRAAGAGRAERRGKSGGIADESTLGCSPISANLTSSRAHFQARAYLAERS